MNVFEQSDPKSRLDFIEMRFNHQVDKAYRKGKFVDVSYEENGIQHNVTVDPAYFNFQLDSKDVHDEPPLRPRLLLRMSVQRRVNNSESCVSYVFDSSNMRSSKLEKAMYDFQQYSMKNLYQYIFDADPTSNKEYLQWIMNMYTRILKDREPSTLFISDENVAGSAAYLFFEDLSKLKHTLDLFHKIKSTRLVPISERDIYTYKTISDFIGAVFMMSSVSTEINTNVFTNKELSAISDGSAEIVHQDNDWIVVHTKTKSANDAFGEQTTWCTAGTRYGSNMFDSYNSRDKLFVMVKNSVEANSHIKHQPDNRLQFHFQSNQYMDALDRSVNILKFFDANTGIKMFFRDHIISLIKPSTSLDETINLLTKFGLVKELIPILQQKKIKNLDLSGILSKQNAFELDDLGQLSTLEELTIRNCNLEVFPKSIRHLHNLKKLRLSGNKIEKIPDWVNELHHLQILNIMQNRLGEPFDVSGMSGLLELNIAFNKNLAALPTGLGNLKLMNSFDFSMCDIQAIPDEILQCVNLIQINAIRNIRLSKLPEEIINLPELKYLGIEGTNISDKTIKKLNEIKVNKLTSMV